MVNEEEKIRLIHEYRTVLLNRMFDELCQKPPSSSTGQVSDDIVATAEAIRTFLTRCDEIGRPARGLFVLALQQVVDTFIAGLLTNEAFEWLAEQQNRAD
jgi:hypothetical protein